MNSKDERVSSSHLSILMISTNYSPLVGGTERSAERLSIALASRGHNITMLTLRRNKLWPSSELQHGVKVYRYWCLNRPKLFAITSMLSYTVFLIVKGHSFDIWHLHQSGLNVSIAVLLGKLLRKKVIFKMVYSCGNVGLSGMIATRRFPFLSIALHKRIDALIVLTRETEAEANLFGINSMRTIKIGNGVDTSAFYPRNIYDRIELKEKLGITSSNTVISVGRLASEKNIDGLLHAWGMAKKSLSGSWKLLIVGDGPMRNVLEKIIRDQALEESVCLLGMQNNMEEWMAASDIYVLSSPSEGMSNTLIEAMASALPVVTTKVSGAIELVEETGAGIVVEVGNMRKLADALIKLSGDSSLRNKMGFNGHQVIEKNFTIQAVTDKYEALYYNLIK